MEPAALRGLHVESPCPLQETFRKEGFENSLFEANSRGFFLGCFYGAGSKKRFVGKASSWSTLRGGGGFIPWMLLAKSSRKPHFLEIKGETHSIFTLTLTIPTLDSLSLSLL